MDYYKNADKKCGAGVEGLYNAVLSVAPFGTETEPVSVQDLKDWGKIEQDVDDAIVTALGKAARIMCEKFSNIGFINRQVTVTILNANGCFVLPYGPVTGEPTAADGDGTAFDIEYQFGAVTTTGKMTVTYQAGYATLPDDLATALKAQFLFLYENRGESQTTLSPIARMILEPQRMVL